MIHRINTKLKIQEEIKAKRLKVRSSCGEGLIQQIV